VIADEVSPWRRHQCRQTLHELERCDHVCEFMHNDGYPFQSQAIGCDARGWLWRRVDAFDDRPVQRGILTTDGDVRYIEAASDFRTGWEHYGRRWTVVDRDEG